MNRYRLALNLHGSKSQRAGVWLPAPPDLVVGIYVDGYTEDYARGQIRNVSVTRDMTRVSIVGGTGFNGATYDNWDVLSIFQLTDTGLRRIPRDCGRVLVVRGKGNTIDEAWAEYDAAIIDLQKASYAR